MTCGGPDDSVHMFVWGLSPSNSPCKMLHLNAGEENATFNSRGGIGYRFSIKMKNCIS